MYVYKLLWFLNFQNVRLIFIYNMIHCVVNFLRIKGSGMTSYNIERNTIEVLISHLLIRIGNDTEWLYTPVVFTQNTTTCSRKLKY